MRSGYARDERLGESVNAGTASMESFRGDNDAEDYSDQERFFVSLNDCKYCTNLCSNQQIWFATDSVGKVEKERCKTEEAAKAVCQKWVGGPTPASQIIGAGRRNWRNNETESRTGPALWLQYAIHRCSRQKQVEELMAVESYEPIMLLIVPVFYH